LRYDVFQIRHLPAHRRFLRAARYRENNRVAVLVLAHDGAVGRASFDHQVDELARIPVDVRVDNAGVAVLHSVLPFVRQLYVDAELHVQRSRLARRDAHFDWP
jgi:hypothetical protein